jgi:hypothetical protein
MQPLSTFEAPARISGACDAIPNIGYIWARSYDSPYFDGFTPSRESAAGGARSLHAGTM